MGAAFFSECQVLNILNSGSAPARTDFTFRPTLIGILTKFHLVSSGSVGFHAGPCVFICEVDESLRSFKVFRLLNPEAYPSGLRSESMRESRPIIQLCFLVAL